MPEKEAACFHGVVAFFGIQLVMLYNKFCCRTNTVFMLILVIIDMDYKFVIYI